MGIERYSEALMQKFSDGDQVIIRRDNYKTPKWILRHARLDRPRRIVMHSYSKTRQHTLYYVGYNWRGVDLSYYGFMPAQLRLWVKGKVGHPKKKWGEKTRDRKIANAIYNSNKLKAEKTNHKPVLKKKIHKQIIDSGYSESAKIVKRVSKCIPDIKQKERFKQYSNIRSTTRGFNEGQTKYIFERDEATCVYCGAPAEEIDHVISWKDGGQTIVSNGVCTCKICNRKKIHHDSIKMLTRAIYWLMQKGEDMSWTDAYINNRYGKHTNKQDGLCERFTPLALNAE